MALNTHSLDLERDSSQFASRADNASLSITGDFSFEAWVKLESTGITQTIISKNDNGGGQRSYAIGIGTDNKPLVTFYSHISFADGFWSREVSDTALVIDTWTHIAVTVDVSVPTMKWYINGSLVASTTANATATSIADCTADFVLGADMSSGTKVNHFDGLVDEVRLWNDIRTAAEISANYMTQLTGGETNFVGYWKLNNNYNDETSNENHLTASGSPVFSISVPFVGTEDTVETGYSFFI